MSDDGLPDEVDPAEVAGLLEEGTKIMALGFPTPEDEAKRLIDPMTVETIFMDCLYREEELVDAPPADVVWADGVVNKFGFHPGRLDLHRSEVSEILKLLPSEFRSASQGGGGGWSFLMGCNDKNGTLWTGLHRRVEQLLALGIALGYVKCQFPRAFWSALPGGVPYYEITL